MAPDLACTTGDSKVATLWNTRDGSCFRLLRGHTDRVWAACGVGNFVRGPSPATQPPVAPKPDAAASLRPVSPRLRALTAPRAPRRRQIATGSWDKTVRIWDRAGLCKHTLKGHHDKARACA